MTVAVLGPPTAHLPSIGKIKSCSIADLIDAIHYLILLYNPEIHGSRIVDRRPCPLRAGARPRSPCSPRRRPKPLQVQAEANLAAVRADSFERAYAVRWLTALVSQALLAVDEEDALEVLIEQASRLLAICAGPASAGTRSRTFVFSSPSLIGIPSIKVQVTDLPINNQDYASVGAQTWGGACLLAELIMQSPLQFGLETSSAERPLRILELGAGTGLVSLATAKLLTMCGTSADIAATDFHPAVLENLEQNIADNFDPAVSRSPVSVASHFLDWSHPQGSPTGPFKEPFDTIYGADIVYEPDHAFWIKACVEKLLRKPSISLEALAPAETSESTLGSATHPRFHLVIPSRPTHTTEAQSVEKAFPFAPSIRAERDSPPDESYTKKPYTLAITMKETILCEDAVWSNDSREVEYVHYVISWA